ncbi:MAG: TonB-dependent receptor [Candidatus Aminicenantales bacterium]
MNLKRFTFVMFLCIALVAMLGAQVARQSGVIRGTVTDNEGNPIPGMTITGTSPSQLGAVSDITNIEGNFRLPNLSPGTYTLMAEMQGFKTLRREGLIVQVGQSITVNLQTEPSSLNEEVTITASAPTVDLQSTKVGGVVTGDMIQRLPLNRDLTTIFNTVPGASGTIVVYSGSIHGGASSTTAFEVDGVNANEVTHNGLSQAPQFDTMEEIEISTGGLPAQVGNTGGSFVNIVTKSGGNSFSGQLQAYYTNEHLNEVLFPAEQLKAMGMGKPSAAKFDLDISAVLGGPIIKDKVWFFAQGSRRGWTNYSSFIPTTILGKSYEQYDDPNTQIEGFLKFTTQVSRNLRFFVMANARVLDREIYGGGGSRLAFDNTFTLINNTWTQATANVTWIPSANTFVDFRAGYVNRWYPITAKPEFRDNIGYQDRYTNYQWNGINTWESYITRRASQASARMTHFADNILGGDHEIGAGIEWLWGKDRYGFARGNPLSWDYYNGNPYYYRGYYNRTTAHPVYGDGRLYFTNYAKTKGGKDSFGDVLETRIGAYIQDSWTIKNRLTINMGVRADYYNGWGGEAINKGIDGLPFQIGQVLESQLGFNPFGAYTTAPIKGVLKFTTISPRIGLTYDLFGDGKTALKASFSRYAEAVPTMWFGDITPTVMTRYQFNWFDDNGNGTPDAPGTDHYVPSSGLSVFSRPDPVYLASRVDPDLTTPYYYEYVLAINHELFKDFSLKLQYLHKTGHNQFGSQLYDKATGKEWQSYELAPEWWVPFTTTVPAYGVYPAQEVTCYFLSNNAPYDDQFRRQTVMGESRRKYDAIEVAFDKRFSRGWSIGGSIVLSKHMRFDAEWPDANSFVNGYGRDGTDSPLSIKLYGSFDLPGGFIGSFFYRHFDGSPYARGISIAAPEDWAAANNINLNYGDAWVYTETVGTRRNQSFDNLDLRFEKQFDVRYGKIGVFVDVYNLLGNRYVTYGQDPGGLWNPKGFGSAAGSYTNISSTYGKATSISGIRTYKFSLRFTF